jgi:hypothetical protein
LAVQQQQRDLCIAHPGLQAALMRRAEADAVQATLMEVYATPGEGLPPAALRQRIEAAMAVALQGLVQGERHGEGFCPCA